MTSDALAGGAGSLTTLRTLVDVVLDAVCEGGLSRGGPVVATTPARLATEVAETLGEVAPAAGEGAPEALATLARLLAHGSADPADPACAAHLHCPPLAVAVAADLAVSLLNPSLDSWDQAPAATTVEAHVVAALARLVGYGPQAGGVVTGGGSESNLMGLLLARSLAIHRATGLDVDIAGLAPGVRMRVYCSQAAHFSVQRSAALLGLGERAVVPVAVDGAQRMDPAALVHALAADAGTLPCAVVATAGTTDTGSIDPLPAVAGIAASWGAWLHVDAAYGGGALLSAGLRDRLTGIEKADSVSLDWHKLGWQPVPAGAFLVKDAASFAPLARRVAYLNPGDDEDAGYGSLLGHSLRTTRRADVFKIAVTLRALGRDGLGELVDRCHALAEHAASRISADQRLELAVVPVLTTVVFRYVATPDPDRLNAALRRRLLREGTAVIGRTELRGAVHLKLTLLNPHATPADVDRLIDAVCDAAVKEDRARTEMVS